MAKEKKPVKGQPEKLRPKTEKREVSRVGLPAGYELVVEKEDDDVESSGVVPDSPRRRTVVAPETQEVTRPRCPMQTSGYEWTDPQRQVWLIPEQCTEAVGHAGPHLFAPVKERMQRLRWWDDTEETWQKSG